MITIAWDVDDCLNDLMRQWLQNLCSYEYPDRTVSYDELTENPPCRILKISQQEYFTSLDKFRTSKFAANMEPVREVWNWFEKFGFKCRHIALTATPLKTAPLSAKWVLENYGNWIRSYNFIPAMRSGVEHIQYDKNKGEFIKWLQKVDIFIDDNEENIAFVRKHGIHCILMPRPWNGEKRSISHIMNELTKIIV